MAIFRVPSALHLDLDGAWPAGALGLPTVDLRAWGPRLRFCARDREVEEFRAEVAPRTAGTNFLLYGSGDFHHLSALWLRRHAEAGPITLVSFDNHPDWDIRPPKWCCGSWVNRALDLPSVERAAVWGCGNFECWGWHRLTGNRRDVRSGRLSVHAWADERPAADCTQPIAITREDWREKFSRFAESLTGRRIYVTIDLDGLRAEDAATNWENGRFAPEDIAWAMRELRTFAPIVAGDLCGAWSPQGYARWRQCFAANMDHPDAPVPDATARAANERALGRLWPILTDSEAAEKKDHRPQALPDLRTVN